MYGISFKNLQFNKLKKYLVATLFLLHCSLPDSSLEMGKVAKILHLIDQGKADMFNGQTLDSLNDEGKYSL